MKIESSAKANLVLDILKKREDGFHEVEIVMQELSLKDFLEFKEIEEDKIVIKGLETIPLDERNLCFKAAQELKKDFGIEKGIEISLDKKIPVAGGFGGGSSNAVATFKALDKLWKLNLSKEKILQYSASIGSDTCFFVFGGTCIARGRGEIIEEIAKCPKLHLLFVVPKVEVPEQKTKWIYSNFKLERVRRHPSIKEMKKAIEEKSIEGIAANIGNAFEEGLELKEYKPVFQLIKELKKRKEVLNAAMLGAGPTVFALCEGKNSTLNLRKEFQEKGIPAIYSKTA